MSYEAEQNRLLRLLRVVEEEEDPIDEESDPNEDNVAKRTEETDTEQEGDSEEECAERLLKAPRMSAFLGKDRRITWNKHNIPNKKLGLENAILLRRYLALDLVLKM
ncbi:hypothetical protein ILUMI_15317 [Ignelater luminosus]|uniref:Uncharacterized protein n=1 Tax=Ignelater luminosus TaxID=2038154 RepID=A0A8K0CSI4_IGNLU|nr:hypothetical protein ILUMI_15317 [Ignelater luminosus]